MKFRGVTPPNISELYLYTSIIMPFRQHFTIWTKATDSYWHLLLFNARYYFIQNFKCRFTDNCCAPEIRFTIITFGWIMWFIRLNYQSS